jgi:hypothetical protein
MNFARGKAGGVGERVQLRWRVVFDLTLKYDDFS